MVTDSGQKKNKKAMKETCEKRACGIGLWLQKNRIRAAAVRHNVLRVSVFSVPLW